MALAAGTRLGPYEIIAPLGAGGMGEVYRARDTRLQREVAIKILPAAVTSDPNRLARQMEVFSTCCSKRTVSGACTASGWFETPSNIWMASFADTGK